ncbi:MAG: chorismate synthase [Clostridia bacterium]|nr:chorismate synthase [Clostridia bacterium]
MKNTFGQSISVTLFGESHGTEIGAVVDGLAPGIRIDEEYISYCLDLRRPYGRISTPRVEKDNFRIVSGAFEGYTTGTPLTILIPNENVKSADYSYLKDTPRPSHADYTAECKYHGFQDYRGGGHFSGRITAPLVAVGAILRYALADKGIKIATHIKKLADISDREIRVGDIDTVNEKKFAVISDSASELMQSRIEAAARDGDSVGGVLETIVAGMPVGVGEPFFDSIESVLSHLLFSIPAVKGVEFGLGFGFADMTGSVANDPFIIEGGEVKTATNNNGGINGGISNGMPMLFRCAVKPTPSIFKEQSTVSMKEMKDTSLTLCGRHDPAIIHRARAVVDAVTAIALADLLAMRYGTDYLKD